MTLITPPDTNTWMILLVNAIGLVIAIWRNSQRNYQHRAMWEEYAAKKKIPRNGGH